MGLRCNCWTQLTFSWESFDAQEPALPCDLHPWGFVGTPTHVNVGLSRGGAAQRCAIIPRKGAHVLFSCCLPPSLRLSPNVEPSSTVVSLEWLDVQPAIGTKVSDYVLQHKKVDEYTDTDLYTGGCEGGQPPRGAEGSWWFFLSPTWLGAAALVKNHA